MDGDSPMIRLRRRRDGALTQDSSAEIACSLKPAASLDVCLEFPGRLFMTSNALEASSA